MKPIILEEAFDDAYHVDQDKGKRDTSRTLPHRSGPPLFASDDLVSTRYGEHGMVETYGGADFCPYYKVEAYLRKAIKGESDRSDLVWEDWILSR